jgi:hypothetical protein
LAAIGDPAIESRTAIGPYATFDLMTNWLVPADHLNNL